MATTKISHSAPLDDEVMNSIESLSYTGATAYGELKLHVGAHFALYGMLTSKNNLYFYSEKVLCPPHEDPVWAQMRKKDDTHILKIYGVSAFEPYFRNPAFLKNVVLLDKRNKEALFLHMNYECGSISLSDALETPTQTPLYSEDELRLIHETTEEYAKQAPKELPKVLAAIRTQKNNVYFLSFEKDESDLSASDLDELRRADDTIVKEATCIYGFMNYHVPKKLMSLLLDLHSENAHARIPKRIHVHRTMFEFWGAENYHYIRKKAGQGM
jgi:hypothetical protein